MVFQRKRAYALARGRKQSIAQRRCQWRLGRFAHAAPKAARRRNNGLHFGHFIHAHHAVIVEIGLLDASIFDRHLAPKNGCQTMYHAALQLRLDVVGVDRITRINADHDAVNAYLAFGVNRDLANTGCVTAVAISLPNAAKDARRQRLVPIGCFGHGLQDATVSVGLFIVGQ